MHFQRHEPVKQRIAKRLKIKVNKKKTGGRRKKYKKKK
tara:strand:- start:159 stop:272 length:114 start_codon:yes stop_codon:yes gene_type:complete